MAVSEKVEALYQRMKREKELYQTGRSRYWPYCPGCGSCGYFECCRSNVCHGQLGCLGFYPPDYRK